MADALLKRCIARLPFFHGWVIAGIAFVTMAVGVAAIGAFYRRLSARIGKSKAVPATARKIAVLFFNALRHGMNYIDLGGEASAGARGREPAIEDASGRAGSR